MSEGICMINKQYVNYKYPIYCDTFPVLEDDVCEYRVGLYNNTLEDNPLGMKDINPGINFDCIGKGMKKTKRKTKYGILEDWKIIQKTWIVGETFLVIDSKGVKQEAVLLKISMTHDKKWLIYYTFKYEYEKTYCGCENL